jgi:rubredoxin
LESHFDEPVEDDGDSGDDIDAENCFYNNDQDWSCPVDEDSSESSDDEFNEPEKQGRNRIRYRKVIFKIYFIKKVLSLHNGGENTISDTLN